MSEIEALRAALRKWTMEFGPALKPLGADTYGEGMRAAKSQVARILSAHPTPPEPVVTLTIEEAVDIAGLLDGYGSPCVQRLRAKIAAAKEAGP